ncbi:MAG: hypothetical protein DRN27_05810 [Thermoplasmata archaeon]|nr:MAG: hypothetical protein DRN27_05810 [Thermoplasmata archaeon]
MGHSNWSNDAYTDLSSSKSYATKSADDIFSKSVKKDMLPKDVDVRESRDSDAHPESLAVAIFLDDTGSMGRIPEDIVKNELPTLMNTIIDNGVEHPQILFGAINDHHCMNYCDAPIQIGQFESGTDELDKWLTSVAIQGGGGAQSRESYLLAWYFAGRHTSIDCFEKRNEKGFLFTIGDEMSWDSLSRDVIEQIFGGEAPEGVTDKQLLEEAQRLYNVYHIHVNEASYRDDPTVLGYWKDMLGERLIIVNDYTAICATIATLIAVQHGVDINDVTSKFDSKIAGLVTTALATVATGAIVSKNDDGVIKL